MSATSNFWQQYADLKMSVDIAINELTKDKLLVDLRQAAFHIDAGKVLYLSDEGIIVSDCYDDETIIPLDELNATTLITLYYKLVGML